ncbi:N-acetylglucosaminylphosphatidylinositol deacetylase [Besnoitia besnoiti]|uniref:N-acetylglucosaminylphosphatidylinositol deacetylase n=1 Tax=Besnoitia besnoiti TaxID=94643 RepID=A0A2A9M5H8_BESBE|nr:N-acetylglucosaminylphosphatidylinositol deacetylase [Besnoitia besnoiti]PFH33215.1 N-acetylglucosaminylphosphatidylinositol deacetylase [Besnoitia besnoiti]
MERIQRRLARHSRVAASPASGFSGMQSVADLLLVLVPLFSVAVSLLSTLLHAQVSHSKRFLRVLLNARAEDASDAAEIKQPKAAEGNKERRAGEGGRGDVCAEKDDAPAENDKHRVALVVAHPDDEVMFYSPTLSLLRDFPERVEVFLLCLSTGNADGRGPVRAKEILAAADVLSVGRERVTLVDETTLQDGWQTWPAERVADLVAEFVADKDISTIFTFDASGVSSHPNHISVYDGVRLLWDRQRGRAPAQKSEAIRASSQKEENGEQGATKRTRRKHTAAEDAKEAAETPRRQTEVYVLRSHGLLRKYSGVLDVVAATMECRNLPNRIVAVKLTPFLSIRGMCAHWSQFVWFRWFFVFFSSYTYANVFDKLVAAE